MRIFYTKLDNLNFCATIVIRIGETDRDNVKVKFKDTVMKKVLVSVFALTALAGCASYYDYYKGGIRYTQDGEDCVYYAGEYGRNFSSDIAGLDNGKKIVYRNTRCADLYARDNFGAEPRHDRQALVPAAREVSCTTCNAQPVQVVAPVQVAAPVVEYGCKTCNQPVLKRRYVIVPAM